jgi:hypothetical protein
MNPPLIPNAKFDNLVVQEFANEILIYNLKNNKAYSLNETSTLVWKNCDGKKDITQIAAQIEETLNQKVPEDLVWLALDNLKKEGLITLEGDSAKLVGINRREVIKKVGLATMAALPLLVSITAPTAANAQSNGIEACTDCVTDLGIIDGEPVGVCPEACAGLMCTCFGNNSCMGVGQIVENITCDTCRSVDNNDMNNSWRCGAAVI